VTVPIITQSWPGGAYLARKAEIDAAISRVLASGWYILGEEVRAFEAEFAAFVGVAHAVGVASGTDAIELSLRALGIGRGDAVYTVSHTALATVAAIERAGATAVLVDVDSNTATLDAARLDEALTRAPASPRPRAVVLVHLYGQPGDVAGTLAVARRHSLRVVEDCAQSHGATVAGRMTGGLADIAAFSFYPTKNLGAFGDGGMVVTADASLAASVRRLREYGWDPRPISEAPGLCSRLDELQAAILRVGLRALAGDNARRREIAAAYDRGLSGLELGLPTLRAGTDAVYHQYVCRSARRDELREWLDARGIETAVHYPVPVHLQPAYAGRVICPGPLTVTEKLAREVVSLPLHPWLGDANVERVAREVRAFHGVSE
jgi:dTDP-4-amino-4,6-dideoxygalactose transaminase